MTVLFTSDLHFGHRKAAEHRGFADAEQHDRALVENWNAAVTRDDDVWILGDLAASSPTYALSLLRTLPGRKHLISGNHDKTHPMHRDSHKHLRTYLGAFESVQSAARRRIDGREVLLSHFPYRRDRGEMRHGQWRLREEGLWLLHGHTHGRERLTHFSREVHVGVDAWDLAPVRLDEVNALIEQSEQARAGNARVLAATAARRFERPAGFITGPNGEVYAR